MKNIFDGYMEGRQFDWKNRITGKNKGELLADAKGIEYVHVGYHRTGATFLQQEVFPKYKAAEKIFSDDVLCGRLFDTGIDAVEFVHKAHPDATILIVIRSQPSIINSAYRNYVKRGGVWSFPMFAKEMVSRKKYDYLPMVKKYIKYFGKDNCQVMIFENLFRSPNEYIENVVKFIGEKEVVKHDLTLRKPAPSNLYNELLRYVNIFSRLVAASGFDSLYIKLFRSKKAVPSWRFRKFCTRFGVTIDDKFFKKIGLAGRFQFGYKSVLPVIKTTYASNNSELSELINVDLGSYNYPVL